MSIKLTNEMLKHIKQNQKKICPICQNTGLTNKIPEKNWIGKKVDSGRIQDYYFKCWNCC